MDYPGRKSEWFKRHNRPTKKSACAENVTRAGRDIETKQKKLKQKELRQKESRQKGLKPKGEQDWSNRKFKKSPGGENRRGGESHRGEVDGDRGAEVGGEDKQ